MCDSPILIRNPNCGAHPRLGSPLALKDCTSAFIPVPCGHCPSCIANKQMQLVQRVQMESLGNHLFFATLTYNERSLPRLTVSTGYDIPYFQISDLQNMFKRLRKQRAFGRPFRYLAVSELGGEKGRPHAHVLFMVPRFKNDTFLDCLNLQDVMFNAVLHEWRRNSGSTRAPVWSPLCTFVRRYVRGRLSTNYDLHYCTARSPGDSLANVAFYVLKYMLKRSDRETRVQQALRLNLPPVEYNDVWSVVRSRYVASLGFGLAPSDGQSISPVVYSYLRDCVRRSKDERLDYPCYWSPESGNQFPLSRYYRNDGRIYSYADALDFYLRKQDDRIDTVVDDSFISSDVWFKRIRDYERKLKQTELDSFGDGLFDDLPD